MPDICMCMNEKCKSRNSCYRFMAVPTPYMQSFGDFKYAEDGDCKHYWDIKIREGFNLSKIEKEV